MGSKDHRHTWSSTGNGYVCTDCSAFVEQKAVTTANDGTHPTLERVIKKAWATNGEGTGHGG
jgi:hypothetical protein